MRGSRVVLSPPAGFSLASVVKSHGWSDLPPFRADGEGLGVVLRLSGGVAEARVVQDEAGLHARFDRALFPAERREAADALGSCLRFPLDLEPFYALCREDPALAWAPAIGAGRLLRAPDVFTDAALTLATTNCSWGLTRAIVAALVARWGERGAFPTREALASASEADLRRHGRLGYRAPFLRALARDADLDGLRDDPSPTPVLRKRLLALPGFGPYAAENLLRLLGRHEHLALDSWVLRKWRGLFPRSRPTERAIARRLARYGDHRGLALWLLVTADWHRT